MKSLPSTQKLILLHPYTLKQSTPTLTFLLASLSLLSLLTFFLTHSSPQSHPQSQSTPIQDPRLPIHVTTALLHYASTSNSTSKMSLPSLTSLSHSLRLCPPPCNLLVFGLSHESLLWRSLNSHGRTVFIDENRYTTTTFEDLHPEIEAYDVQYTTKNRDHLTLIASAKESFHNECRPVQNLLFSECRVALNDLPNQLYDVVWDVILVDGPRGHWPDAPGRVASIFTAAVLARTSAGKRAGPPRATRVFVHDYNLEPNRAAAEAFLCGEALVAEDGVMAEFAVGRMEESSTRFCFNSTVRAR